MINWRAIKSDQRGVAAIEFAMILPILLAFLFGMFQVGVIAFNNAGLNNALGEATRLASLYPAPTNAQIQARITAERFGITAGNLSTPTIVRGKNGTKDFADITMTYNFDFDAIFASYPVTLTRSRRAYLQAN